MSQEDYEIIKRRKDGESVVKLAQEYHRSKSSIYRMLQSMEKNTLKHPQMSLEDQEYAYIPIQLCPILLACPTTSSAAYTIFKLTVTAYQSGYSAVPRNVLIEILPRLSSRKRALRAIEELADMRWSNGEQKIIYSDISYSNGIPYMSETFFKSLISEP